MLKCLCLHIDTQPHLQTDSAPLTVMGVGDNPVYDAAENNMDTRYFQVDTPIPMYHHHSCPESSINRNVKQSATASRNTNTEGGEFTPAALSGHTLESGETEREFKNPIYDMDP